jgi:hypothetical protein
MSKTCTQCQSQYEVTDLEKRLLHKISPTIRGRKYSLPEPKKCRDCRIQQLLPWRSELYLFKRNCDLTGKPMLSHYPPGWHTVYDNDVWLGDDWNPLDYGKDYDFNKPFFEQFAELFTKVPLRSRGVKQNENSEYTNCCGWNKNCYLIAAASENESCFYSNYIDYSNNCSDCNFVKHSELCYECIDCQDCYNLKYSSNCINCNDSYFLYNCRNSKNCFGSVNLVGKEYIFMNKQLTKIQYQEQLANLELHKHSRVEQAQKFFQEHKLKFPHKYRRGEMNENVTGDAIYSSRNCENCFDAINMEDSSNVIWYQNGKDIMDCYSFGTPAAEKVFNSISTGVNCSDIICSQHIYGGSNIMYSCACDLNCSYLFGCASLKKKSYCILNKQYSKEEYFELLPRIIEHIIATGEFGYFFPYQMAPHPYNKSMSQDIFPLEKEQALSLGAKWYDDPPITPPSEKIKLPDSIHNVDKSICDQILTCKVSGKPYKIIPQEFRFLKTHNLPLPHLCFEERHKTRLAGRNPRKLWSRQCQKCNKNIETSYSPERPEIVYCEECYLSEVY